MKVILLENLRNVGIIGDIIDVKRGYAKNFLISQKKALFASKDNINEVEKIKKDLDINSLELVNNILNGNITNEIKILIEKMININKELLEYLSPKNWANNILIKTFIIHGANDSMVPFTESTLLAKNIKDSKLMISFLYEHREISTDRGILFKLKEALKMIKFFALFFKYNEN